MAATSATSPNRSRPESKRYLDRDWPHTPSNRIHSREARFRNGQQANLVSTSRKEDYPEEFARMRKEYPEPLSDEAAHEKFDSYTEEHYIEIRLVDRRLNYLVVSRTETAD